MPIYEYHCPKCNVEFELMRALTQSNEQCPCPQCGSLCDKLVSVCSTNADYRIRYPMKDAFRGNKEDSQ